MFYIEQKLIVLTRTDGQYFNFINYGSNDNSLNHYLEAGWIVKEFLHLDRDNNEAAMLMERKSLYRISDDTNRESEL